MDNIQQLAQAVIQWVVQSMVFGVLIFSLLAQGTNNKYLIGKYSG